MYQFSYAEVMQDAVADAKERERQVLDRSIALLSAARDAGKYGREAIEALYYTRRVWISFVEDLNWPAPNPAPDRKPVRPTEVWVPGPNGQWGVVVPTLQ